MSLTAHKMINGMLLALLILADDVHADELQLKPSLDLLEYLGQMVSQGDELIGPADLDDEPEPFPDSIVVDAASSSNEEEKNRD